MSERDRKFEQTAAEKFFNTKCGILHFGWCIDSFWTKVAREILIPGLVSIHDALVAKNISEGNKLSWGDADGDVYYIPSKDRKVIVFTTQSRDYLFILTPTEMFNDSTKKYSDTHSLHIRRIWRQHEPDDIWGFTNSSLKKMRVQDVINKISHLDEYADDSADYPERPSLEMYRKINFNLDEFCDKPRFYGDGRDRGYIISLSNHFEGQKAENTIASFSELNILTTCNLGVMARDLDVTVPQFKGYGR